MSGFARTASGDLDFSAHTLVVVTDPVQCAAWDLQDRLALGLGEWVYDTSQGVPYFSFLGIKNPPIASIREMLRSVILSTPPIVSVVELGVTFNTKLRNLAYTFSAKCDTGQVIVGGTGVPFVVAPPVST